MKTNFILFLAAIGLLSSCESKDIPFIPAKAATCVSIESFFSGQSYNEEKNQILISIQNAESNLNVYFDGDADFFSNEKLISSPIKLKETSNITFSPRKLGKIDLKFKIEDNGKILKDTIISLNSIKRTQANDTVYVRVANKRVVERITGKGWNRYWYCPYAEIFTSREVSEDIKFSTFAVQVTATDCSFPAALDPFDNNPIVKSGKAFKTVCQQIGSLYNDDTRYTQTPKLNILKLPTLTAPEGSTTKYKVIN